MSKPLSDDTRLCVSKHEKKFPFMARMPDETGALSRAEAICRWHAANISKPLICFLQSTLSFQ
jgi:hypothetical protein